MNASECAQLPCKAFVQPSAVLLQVVFSEAWWVGMKEDNPSEAKLPLPQSLIEAGMKAGGACFAWPFLHAAYLVSFPKEKC